MLKISNMYNWSSNKNEDRGWDQRNSWRKMAEKFPKSLQELNRQIKKCLTSTKQNEFKENHTQTCHSQRENL